MSDRIAIHGAGFVGLTAAVHFARAGWHVVIYDPDRATVDGVNAGRPRAGEFLGYLDGDVVELVMARQLTATGDFGAVRSHPVHLVAVPSERDGEPWDATVCAVLARIVPRLPPGGVVLVESTLTPGTIDDVLAGLDAAVTGRVGRDWYLAVCPRRDWFADRERNLETLPRVVGGVTEECTLRAAGILRTVSRELLLTDYRTAEITKAMENAWLHLPVLLTHELACALPDRNVAEAARLASTHWRFASLGPIYLSANVGGRCVPLGTRYLQRAAAGHLTLAEAAIAADRTMPSAIAEAVVALGPRTALVLGVAYRADFRDAGRSPGLAVAREIHAAGVPVDVHDPLWPMAALNALAEPIPATNEAAVGEFLADYDVVVLATPHAAYLDLPRLTTAWRERQVVIDATGAWASERATFAARRVSYRQVGTPGWRYGPPTMDGRAVTDLVVRFWRLPHHAQVRALRQCGLLLARDDAQIHEQRVVEAFARARARGLLADLDEAVRAAVLAKGG